MIFYIQTINSKLTIFTYLKNDIRIEYIVDSTKCIFKQIKLFRQYCTEQKNSFKIGTNNIKIVNQSINNNN